MGLDCASLALAPSWEEEQLIVVRATDAIRLCRDGGYEELPRQSAGAWVDHLDRRHMATVRAFVAQARLAHFPLAQIDDPRLVALLREAIKVRELVVLREGAGERGKQSDSTTEQRRIVREVAAKARRLGFAGKQYRLVPDADLGRLPDRDSYEVVKHEEAVRVLDGIGMQSGIPSGELAQLLVQAKEKLTPDWRPPLEPSGLILLRRIVTLQAYAPDVGPALTPSQMKKLVTQTDWIEVEVVDQDGEPYTGRYRIELPDHSSTEGSFDAEGLLGNYDLEAGNCKLFLIDRKSPKGATSEAAAVEAESPAPPPTAPVSEETATQPAASAAVNPEILAVAGQVAGLSELPAEADLPGVSYQVTLEDEAGVFLDGIDVEFALAGERSRLTSADGQAGLDGVACGGVTVSFPSPKRVKAILKKNRQDRTARTAQAARAASGAPSPSTSLAPGKVEVIVSDEVAPSVIPIAENAVVPLVLRLPPASVSLVELEDVFFRTDSAVVLPDDGSPRPATDVVIPTAAAVLATALRFAQDNPDKKLLVAGHTDSVGTKDHNQALSEDRALATLACLRGDRASFQDISDRRHLVSDIKQILAWAADVFGFLCDPGRIDENGASAVEPIRRFQRGYNGRRDELNPGAAAIAEDGSMGPIAWGAVFDCYDFHLADQLVDSPDAGERRERLQELRATLAFVDDNQPSQGFGETHPVEAVGKDSVRSQANRRVEFLFFDDDEVPSLDGPPETSEVYAPGRFVRLPVPPMASIKRGLGSICLYAESDSPLVNAHFRLTLGGVVTLGQTPDGFIKADLPPGIKDCLVEWSLPDDPALSLADGTPRYRLTVTLTGLDPSSNDGAAAMLGNLGYDGGELDGNLLLFQNDEKLAENGQLDAPTQQSLDTRHAFLANGAKAG